MSTLGVGIIGLGISSPEPWPGYVWTSTRNGLDHADAIDRTDKLHVRALCDIAEGPLEKIARDRGVAWYTDYRDLLDNDEIDIVTVATPNGFHAQMARDALEAGKHVLLEKPMCITLEECESLIATVEATAELFSSITFRDFPPDSWRHGGWRTAVPSVTSTTVRALSYAIRLISSSTVGAGRVSTPTTRCSGMGLMPSIS